MGRLLGDDVFQTPVFIFEAFQPLEFADREPSVFRLPVVVGTIAHPVFAAELPDRDAGLPFFEQLEVIFPGDSRNEVAADEYETTKKRSYLTKKPFKDVQKTMQNLKARGIKAIISSNNFQELVDNLVNRIGIKFDMVLGWRKNFSKGHDHFSHVRKRLGCKMDEMIFIGDSLKAGSIVKYLPAGITAKWQEVMIPLEDFGLLDFSEMG